LTRSIIKKPDLNDYSFARFTLILLLHLLQYVVKCQSRSLVVIYDNELILGSACVGSEMIN